MGNVVLRYGLELLYQGMKYTIVEIFDDNTYQIRSECKKKVFNYTRNHLLSLLEKGELSFPEHGKNTYPVVEGFNAYLFENFSDYPETYQEIAKVRKEIIAPLLHLESVNAHIKNYLEEINLDTKLQAKIEEHEITFQESTIYRWIKDYRESNFDIRSLVPNYGKRGGRTRQRFATKAEEIIDSYVQLAVRNKAQTSTCYTFIESDIRDWNKRFPNDQLIIPTLRTIQRRIKKARAEYAAEKETTRKPQNYKAKKRATSAMESAQFDHTRLDIFLVDDEGNPLGRPWISFIMDEYSTEPLGFYIGFEPPSYISVMYALRHAISSKTYVKEMYPEIKNEWTAYGLPLKLVVDNGKEFRSKHLANACLQLDIELEFCPPGKPWYKGAIERYFRTHNQRLLEKLPGHTPSKLLKLRKSEYDPKKHAVMTLDAFVKLYHKWLIDIYSVSDHKGVKGVPKSLFDDSTENGKLIRVYTNYDELNIILGRVENRKISDSGIRWNHLDYNSPELQKLKRFLEQQGADNRGDRLGDTGVEIKINPDDISKIYVRDEFVKKVYLTVPCTDEKYVKEGLRLYTHDLIVKETRNSGKPITTYNLLESELQVEKDMEKLRNSKKTSSRVKAARYDDMGTNKILAEKKESIHTQIEDDEFDNYDPYGLKITY